MPRMAATMHAKINRKNLAKLNINRICEEILNPSVPMSLRLSGILMGGVAIVYERKVKLLYDDVNRLLVEINEAWKVKAAPSDPTLLPKGKSQAKYKDITLPENHEEDYGEIEHLKCFQQTNIKWSLDNVDVSYIQNTSEDVNQDNHQVDADHITIFDCSYMGHADTSINHSERFDVEGDDGIELNFSQPEHAQIPVSLNPSPPPQEEPQKHKHPDEIFEQYPDYRFNQKPIGSNEAKQNQVKQGPPHRRAKRHAAVAIDYDQIIIPGQIYQSWLQNASDIVLKRGRKRKNLDAISTMKIARLMELPPVVLMEGLFTIGNRVYYPAPLLEQWMRSTITPDVSPSGGTSVPQPPEASSPVPEQTRHFTAPPGYPFEDIQSGIGPQSFEKQEVQHKVILDEENGLSATKTNLTASGGYSGDEIASIPSSASGRDLPSCNSEIDSERFSKKRPYSSSKHSNGLHTIPEEFAWQHPDEYYLRPLQKSPWRFENLLTPDNVKQPSCTFVFPCLFVETAPTQTQQHPIINQQVDHITDRLKRQWKNYFDTPGSAKVESLNLLACGLDKKKAACLFYQTCVLATRDDIKVEQRVPYGEIFISRGANM